MGKRRRGQKGKPTEKRVRGPNDTNDGYPPHKGWDDYVLESKKFVDYYKGLGLIPESEWDQFIEVLKKPLPTTFRITQTSSFAEEVLKKLQQFQEKGSITLEDGTVVEAPQPVSWYPNQGAWHYNISRKALKKSPELSLFHKFLMSQTECGNISRQEAVSMLPPIFLNVEPHHRVLDMCAAPGSKTGQIIEYLHLGEDQQNLPTGLVIANDADYDRCYTLIHQIKRLQSPYVMVTNHEAQWFPYVKEKVSDTGSGEGVTKDGKVTFQFDRVLCDVPCTGDGTMRKNPDIWANWSVAKGLGIHRLQLQIASRGVHLLKSGGRMVYSTCSLNPIEDEAVVAELLRSFKGALRLVDVSSQLPNLKRDPGISKWKVQDKEGVWYNTYEEVTSFQSKKKISGSMFPPTEEEASTFNLQRCMRLLPHHADTGGFFVAVLEKVTPTWTAPETNVVVTPAAATTESSATPTDSMEISKESSDDAEKKPEDNNNAPQNAKPGKVRPNFTKEAPFIPFPADMNPALNNIKEFYGIDSGFPSQQLMIRSEKSLKITYVSAPIRHLFESDEKGALKVINTGVRILNKQDAKAVRCQYRVAQEGIPYIYPFISKRKVVINENDAMILFENKEPLCTQFSENTMKQMEALDQGSIVLIIDPQGKKPWAGMMFAGWKAKVSCHLQVGKEEVHALLQLAKGQMTTVASTGTVTATTEEKPVAVSENTKEEQKN